MKSHAVLILVLAVLAIGPGAFLVGKISGEETIRRKVFKNCLSANISPITCLQYMKIVESTK